MPAKEVLEEPVGAEASLEYISIGCNRMPHALDWGDNGLIAFGACNSVAIYEPQAEKIAGKIVCLLNHHKGKVNCLSWHFSNNGEKAELISGSTDKSICVWLQNGKDWTLVEQLEGHKDAIHALASISIGSDANGEDVDMIASSSADSSVIIWKRTSKSEFKLLQTVSFGNGFALSLAMTLLPKSKSPLLACGCDDTKIHLYSSDGDKFTEVESLQGHEDWIQSIDFSTPVGDDVFIASGSKDSYVRIWKISVHKKAAVMSDELTLEEQKFSVALKEYAIVLESVVSGHDGWVNGVQWKKAVIKDSKLFQPMAILSASMDKTMMIWQLDADSGVWMDTARMGEVGGNSLGLYGCAFSPDGTGVISHGFQGAFHYWKFVNSQNWVPEVTVSGHFGSVEDFDWDPLNSDFIISVSTDQTARLHSPWRQDGKKMTWHEIARPQVHGYDMQCIACINSGAYVSGSEEKVMRVFGAPKSFFESLSTISKITSHDQITADLPLGASVPALGLSNKAVFQSDLESWKDETGDKNKPLKASAFASEDPAPYTPISISCPPPEDMLLQNTLWPEVHKLYGHGFEIFCVACNPQGNILASGCKASKAEFANILLWDTKTWKQVGSLAAHSLTVTQLSFSNSGEWLLSVSRDRTWSLFKRRHTEGTPFYLVQKTDKSTCLHTRIIWSCCWTNDDHYFLTASRDKKVIVWGQSETGNGLWVQASKLLDTGEPVTAVDTLPLNIQDKSYVVAIGKESGSVCICSWSALSNEWTQIANLDKSICPTMTVKRIRWNKHIIPRDQNSSEIFQFYLAVSSSDSSLRILNVPLSLLR